MLWVGNFGDALDHLYAVKAFFDGDASLKLASASETAKFRAESFVFDAPFRTAKCLSAALITEKEHFFFIDVRITQIVDVVVLEGDLLIKALVTDVDILFEQLGTIELLETQRSQLGICQRPMERVVLKADPEQLRTGGKSHLTGAVVVIERRLAV